MKHSTNAGPESTLAVLIEILQLSTEFAVIVTDLDGRVLRWDERAGCLYGYDPEEGIGKAKSEIVNSQTERLFGNRREDLIGQPIKILVPKRFGTRHPTHRVDYSRRVWCPCGG
jgi:PAS domain-containing protein